jgi:maltose-binding protein MalE
MKKTIIIAALAALSLSAVNACNSAATKTEVTKKKSKYTCTMHPDLSFDKPGTCSKCGMELVERDTTAGK